VGGCRFGGGIEAACRPSRPIVKWLYSAGSRRVAPSTQEGVGSEQWSGWDGGGEGFDIGAWKKNNTTKTIIAKTIKRLLLGTSETRGTQTRNTANIRERPREAQRTLERPRGVPREPESSREPGKAQKRLESPREVWTQVAGACVSALLRVSVSALAGVSFKERHVPHAIFGLGADSSVCPVTSCVVCSEGLWRSLELQVVLWA